MDTLEALLDVNYSIVRTQPSDVFDHLPTFVDLVDHFYAVHDGRPHVQVIELGVRYGVSTTAWLWALRDRGDLWAVDGSPPVIEPTMQVDLLNPLMGLDHFHFILGWDTELAVLSQLPDQVDIVFIDTNHIYEETLVELETYLPRVRDGGRILLHDTALVSTPNAAGRPQPDYPVRTAMQEFCIDRGLEYENTDICNGLGQVMVRR
jgi:predicted O-methyltransferase YrrM